MFCNSSVKAFFLRTTTLWVPTGHDSWEHYLQAKSSWERKQHGIVCFLVISTAQNATNSKSICTKEFSAFLQWVTSKTMMWKGSCCDVIGKKGSRAVRWMGIDAGCPIVCAKFLGNFSMNLKPSATPKECRGSFMEGWMNSLQLGISFSCSIWQRIFAGAIHF